MEFVNSKKRKNILKTIILIIVAAILIILGFYLYNIKSSKTSNLNKENEQNKLEMLLKKIKSDLEIVEPEENSIRTGKIQSKCDELLEDLQNTKKEKEMEIIFDKALNYFKTKAEEEKLLKNQPNNAGVLEDIALMIGQYQKDLEEFLKIKNKFEMEESSKEKGVPTDQKYSKEDLNIGRKFLLNYAYILKYYTEDIPNIQKEMSNTMSEIQQKKLQDLEKNIWEYMKTLRKETSMNRQEKLPKIFAAINRK